MSSRAKNINLIKQILLKRYNDYIPGDHTIEFTPSEVSKMLAAADELVKEREEDEPEQKTEVTQVRLVITADKGCLADYLKDLAEYLDSEDEPPSAFEKYKGRVDMKRIK